MLLLPHFPLFSFYDSVALLIFQISSMLSISHHQVFTYAVPSTWNAFPTSYLLSGLTSSLDLSSPYMPFLNRSGFSICSHSTFPFLSGDIFVQLIDKSHFPWPAFNLSEEWQCRISSLGPTWGGPQKWNEGASRTNTGDFGVCFSQLRTAVLLSSNFTIWGGLCITLLLIFLL